MLSFHMVQEIQTGLMGGGLVVAHLMSLFG